MPLREDVDGVLITGVYGAGKSAVAAEIAELLERQRVSYAALDLDWLTWFDTASDDAGAAERVFLKNVSDVVANYLAAGVTHFVMALAVRDRSQLDQLVVAASVPLRVVRLDVSPMEIERRLRADPTTGRGDDLREATMWLANSTGVGFEDLAIGNVGPIQEVAQVIVEWLGWTTPDPRKSRRPG